MPIIRKTINKDNALVKSVIYKDLRNIFFENGTSQGDIETLENENAVGQSIINLILTTPGERLFQNDIGSGINRLLFENISPQTTGALNKLIKLAIENYEPRANLIGMDITPSQDENSYSISIIFSVINRTEPVALDLILNRVR